MKDCIDTSDDGFKSLCVLANVILDEDSICLDAVCFSGSEWRNGIDESGELIDFIEFDCGDFADGKVEEKEEPLLEIAELRDDLIEFVQSNVLDFLLEIHEVHARIRRIDAALDFVD